MDLVKLRSRARAMMMIGSVAILVGTGIMVHGEMDFGDGVLIAGIVLLIIGVSMLARTPPGDQDVV
ncbi:hypothetical protein [Altererythrobacter sp.]|uniref:hypothetical protein n=1 Tax=Altererythrobacter sp. TaxID=1872480 RepID=UPI003D014787